MSLFYKIFLFLSLFFQISYADSCKDLFLGRIFGANEYERLIKRLNGPKTLPLNSPNAAPKFSEQSFKGETKLEAMDIKGNYQNFYLTDYDSAIKMIESKKKEGFWIVFSPSESSQKFKTGHLSIIIGDYGFSRGADGLGQATMSSFPVGPSIPHEAIFKDLRFEKYPYLFAQFFELSSDNLAKLSKFFHDRVYQYHANAPEYHTIYEAVPLTRPQPNVELENCTFFVWSFLMSYWEKVSPSLLDPIQKDFGNLVLSQMPNVQVQNQFENPRNTLSIMITTNFQAKEFLKQALTSGEFEKDPLAQQLLLKDYRSKNKPSILDKLRSKF